MATNDRVERFKAEAADLNLKAGNPSRDKAMQTLGLVLMVAGIVIGILSFVGAGGAEAVGDILEYTTLAVAGVAISVTGAAFFIRYGLGSFLRLFLLRQLYEGQAHIDQVVEAVNSK